MGGAAFHAHTPHRADLIACLDLPTLAGWKRGRIHVQVEETSIPRNDIRDDAAALEGMVADGPSRTRKYRGAGSSAVHHIQTLMVAARCAGSPGAVNAVGRGYALAGRVHDVDREAGACNGWGLGKAPSNQSKGRRADHLTPPEPGEQSSWGVLLKSICVGLMIFSENESSSSSPDSRLSGEIDLSYLHLASTNKTLPFRLIFPIGHRPSPPPRRLTMRFGSIFRKGGLQARPWFDFAPHSPTGSAVFWACATPAVASSRPAARIESLVTGTSPQSCFPRAMYLAPPW